jgi:hypothetical protein
VSEITIKLTKAEAEVISEALGHVWREIFDKEYRGDGLVLRRVLDQLNTITEARR